MHGRGVFKRVFLVACFMAGLAASLAAQTAGTGGLTGTVTDTTGARIPGVTVTATNTETGQERNAISGEDGTYKFALLPPGTYRVKFTLTGFKVIEVPSVKVNVTETPVLDRSLEVGGQAEQVTVEADVAVIQTTSSTLGTVVQADIATALPLTTRNYTNLLGLSAGANASVNNASGFGKGGMEIAVNGGGIAQNNYQMDGVSITGFGNGQVVQGFYSAFAIPNPDTLAEFKIQTSLYDAGYGRNPGASVNVITKSGTNTLHGSAFEFFRNTALNATDFFRNRGCALAPSTCPGGAKQILNQNQFGGVLGGPIKKDKLFFFGSYQQTWQKNGAANQGFVSGITLVPIPSIDRSNTAAFQSALGNAFCPQNHPGDARYQTNPGGAGAGQGLQVACDGSNINPIAVKYLQAKNTDGSYFIPGSTIPGQFQPGVTYSIPAYEREYQGMLNLDYILSPEHTLVSRYFRSFETQTINFFPPAGQPGALPGLGGFTDYGYQNGVLKLTSVVTPSLLNEARVSVNRSTNDQTQNSDPSLYASNIFPDAPKGHGLLGGISPFPPQLFMQGLFTAGGTNDVIHHMTTLQWADQISWTHAKHSMRFGGEFESVRWTWVGSWLSHGVMAFQNFPDFLIGLPGACGTAVLPGADATRPNGCNGSAFSNVLNTTNFTVKSGPSGIVHGYRAKNANWFVQDDYKVGPRLTLNMGLRWEYNGNLSDKYGNLVNLWPSAMAAVPVPGNSPATGSYAGWVVPSNYDTKTWGPLLPGIITSGHKIASRNEVPKSNFAPRLGFAWQPLRNNRFVVRGGAGFFYDRVPGNTIVHSVEQSPPYAPTLDQGPSSNQFSSLAHPFQDWQLGQFPIRWVNFQTQQGSDITEAAMSETFITPLVYSWNLNVQYEVMPRWVLEIGYVGSHGIHLGQWLHVMNEARLASPTNPINGVTTNTVANARLRVPYLGVSPTGLQLADTVGDYKFNSLQATLRKQLSHGITFQGAYTFSRAFSTQTGPGTGPNSGDPLDTRQQYGPNPLYRPHRLVTNYSWDLPGARFQGIAGKLLGGWNIAGVTTIQSGAPLSVLDTRGGAIFGLAGAPPIVTLRAQLAPGTTYKDLVTSGNVSDRLGGASGGPGYINRAALTTIPVIGADPNVPGTGGTGWGNTGVGIILGPGQLNFDTSLSKTTKVGGINEGATLQFRAEFFNLLNHPQFSNPATNFALGNFGQITSTSVNPRLIQLALKYMF